MDTETYLTTALAVLRDHPPGPEYGPRGGSADGEFADLLQSHDWSEAARLPNVLGREFQEALGAYATMIGTHECLPQTVVTASPYGDVDAAALRRLLIDAADAALRDAAA